MIKRKDGRKSFTVRLDKENWVFLKRISAEQEISMMEIITRCIEKYKKNVNECLTLRDTMA